MLEILDKYEGNYNDSLDAYLLSLWAVIEKHKSNQPSYSLFATLIDEAFETQASIFDDKWLAYEEDVIWDYENGSYVIKEHKGGKWIVVQKDVSDYEILKRTILYQIVDFRKLSPDKLKDPQSFFGMDSGRGDTWYNFAPSDYWECATRGMEDHISAPNSLRAKLFRKCTWATLAALLTLGQSYE